MTKVNSSLYLLVSEVLWTAQSVRIVCEFSMSKKPSTWRIRKDTHPDLASGRTQVEGVLFPVRSREDTPKARRMRLCSMPHGEYYRREAITMKCAKCGGRYFDIKPSVCIPRKAIVLCKICLYAWIVDTKKEG